jgi:hypothetical protein
MKIKAKDCLRDTRDQPIYDTRGRVISPIDVRVSLDGEDVTRRCVEADEEAGIVRLLIIESQSASGKVTRFRIGADRQPVYEEKRGRVAISSPRLELLV